MRGIADMQASRRLQKLEIMDEATGAGNSLRPDAGSIGKQIIQLERWTVFSAFFKIA